MLEMKQYKFGMNVKRQAGINTFWDTLMQKMQNAEEKKRGKYIIWMNLRQAGMNKFF